jgi:tellurium resistance protein TerD
MRNCNHCGERTANSRTICPYCKKRLGRVIESKELKCKKCGSTQLTANKKGFGAGKALIGAAFTGGIGLLGGFIGSKKIKITCLNCGNSWKAGENI